MGLAAYSSDVVAENLLIMNSGLSNLVNAAGGFTATIVLLLIFPTILFFRSSRYFYQSTYPF